MSRDFHILAIVWVVSAVIILADYVAVICRKKVKAPGFGAIIRDVFFAPVLAAFTVLAWACDALDWLMKRNEDRKGR